MSVCQSAGCVPLQRQSSWNHAHALLYNKRHTFPPPALQHYCMQQLAEYRPADLLTLFSKFACPPPPAGSTFPDGRPLMHSALLPAAVSPAVCMQRHVLHPFSALSSRHTGVCMRRSCSAVSPLLMSQ